MGIYTSYKEHVEHEKMSDVDIWSSKNDIIALDWIKSVHSSNSFYYPTSYT